MSTDPDVVRQVDGRGIVVAVNAVLAAGATFLVTAGSGAGPAALAFLLWMALVCTASWAAFVDEASTARQWVGAVALAAVCLVGLWVTVMSWWALVFPLIALGAALVRTPSSPRFVAMAAWLAAGAYVILGTG